jgi:hypothetical protein
MRPGIVALLLGVSVVGCRHDAQQSATAGKGVTVELLFEHEGVKVYRFLDGRYHYYAVPSSGAGATTFSTWTENCGKNCNKTVVNEMPTTARR